MNIARVRLVLLVMIVALLAAACGGAASPTSVPADSGSTTGGTTGGDAASAGSPADAVQGFFDALYAGDDPTAFVCTASPEIAEAYRQGAEASAAAMQGATVDTSGLTYTVSEETADSASVEVAGQIVYTVSGTDTPVPFTAISINVVNEDGAWKICA